MPWPPPAGSPTPTPRPVGQGYENYVSPADWMQIQLDALMQENPEEMISIADIQSAHKSYVQILRAAEL